MNQDDRLGPYRLLRRLGEGGMGVVHLGVDPQGRQVAVKVLRAEVAGDDVARRRLSREVETMRRVRNAHIAEVVDADVTGHRPYIVTRYVPGRPLDELVKEDGPLDQEALVRVGYGVADALAAVHAAGVIHRDLKPGNVMMVDGEPVLIDFGIAQAVDATRLTQTGMFIGTPGYLAPEIIEGGEAGPKIDVHAWAGTLIYAATGQPPFGKGTLEMIFFNITAGKANVDGAPQALRPILRAALSRDPARRPTAVELVEHMARLRPAPAGRPSPGGPHVPDDIVTVPNLDPPPVSPTAAPPVSAPVQPPAPPPAHPSAQPSVPARGQRQEEYISLLGQDPAGSGEAEDPWPTVRVTGKDLRSAGLLGEASPPSAGQNPAAPTPAYGSSSPWQAPAPPKPQDDNEGDIPTRRVRPGELANLVRPQQPQQAVDGLPFGRLPPDNVYEQTPHRRHPNAPPARSAVNASPPPQPQVQPQPQPLPQVQPQVQPQIQPQVQVQPPAPAPVRHPPGSGVYTAVSALLLLAVVALAVRAPTLVILLTLPVTVLLRAADMAQPRLNERRPATAAGGDLLRVFGQPVELLKSLAYTTGLLLYGAILGLPVTLFLTVFVPMVDTSTALSWGLAVALWTVCAGPGVDGPRRQMRRMLASMFPSRSTAMTMAGVAGAVAAAAALFALLTLFARAQGIWWQPLEAGGLLDLLDGLRQRAQSQ